MVKKLLIVDDEADMLDLLKCYFTRNGYYVMAAANGQQALEKAGRNPDLILLDINMPDLDGLEVCRRIRDYVSCPILFLTARVSDKDKIAGLKMGGDDYIIKPFSIEELGARVDAHLRREERRYLTQKQLSFDDEFVIDYSAREIRFQGEALSFKRKEYEIIELLSRHPGQLMDRNQIFEHIWEYDSDSDPAVIMAHISSIRAKFARADCKPYIQTVWGSGYKWVK